MMMMIGCDCSNRPPLTLCSITVTGLQGGSAQNRTENEVQTIVITKNSTENNRSENKIENNRSPKAQKKLSYKDKIAKLSRMNMAKYGMYVQNIKSLITYLKKKFTVKDLHSLPMLNSTKRAVQ